ncbi:MAG: ABC transporter permease [Clostridia bacterium]|nr:ABC transporter permease [Clostridia bacterium]
MNKFYVLKRILYTLFIFAVVVTLCFLIPRLGVEDPCSRYYPAQGNMTDEQFEYIKELTRQQYGLDGSVWSQFIRYIGELFSGNLGTSYQSGNPKVLDLIADRLPWTLTLSITNLLISLVIGVIIGTYCASKRGRWQDKTLLNASTITTAVPAFFIALLLSFYFGFQWEIFPAYTDQNLVSSFGWNWESISAVAYNAALPVISMVIGGIISYAQSTRDSVIAVSNENFIITARAKGVSNSAVLYKHTLRNALLPIVTNVGMSISGLIGGSVVIEQIFNWNGIGTLFLEANNTNDYPLMMGIMIFTSAFALVANLVTDLCYSLLDPRVSLGGRR